MAPLLGEGLPRRYDSHDKRRPCSTRHQQEPAFESQPDLVLNTVIILKCVENPIKKIFKKGSVTAITFPDFSRLAVKRSRRFSRNLGAASSSLLSPRVQLFEGFGNLHTGYPLKNIQQSNRVGKCMHGCGCERKHHVIWWGKFNIPRTSGASKYL